MCLGLFQHISQVSQRQGTNSNKNKQNMQVLFSLLSLGTVWNSSRLQAGYSADKSYNRQAAPADGRGCPDIDAPVLNFVVLKQHHDTRQVLLSFPLPDDATSFQMASKVLTAFYVVYSRQQLLLLYGAYTTAYSMKQHRSYL